MKAPQIESTFDRILRSSLFRIDGPEPDSSEAYVYEIICDWFEAKHGATA